MVPFIRLKKAHVMNGKKWTPGKIFRTSRDKMNRLVSEGIAEQYEGPIHVKMPRDKKMKLNLKDL